MDAFKDNWDTLVDANPIMDKHNQEICKFNCSLHNLKQLNKAGYLPFRSCYLFKMH